MLRGRLLGVLASVGLVLAAACSKNPATGSPQLALMSTEQEIRLGEQAARQVVETIGLVDDARLQTYVATVGRRLAARSERPELPWMFAVVDDPSVNAFALPGGKIFVTRGMMGQLNDEAQLASVLGHEIGHVTARHSVERISEAQLAQLGLGLGAVFSPEVRMVAPLASLGLNLLFLKFSRDDEYQADQLGIRYASRASYDVGRMADVFRTLDRIGQQEGAHLPEWLATHPNPENRVERIVARVAQLEGELPRLTIGRQAYMDEIEGLPYGTDPRNGFAEDGRFHHPALRFSIDLPRGWRVQSLNRSVAATPSSGDAVVQVRVGEAADPAATLKRFLGQRGITGRQPIEPIVPELPSASAWFVGRTEDGQELGGLVTFVSNQGRLYQVLALTLATRLRAHDDIFVATHRTFRTLDDPRLLSVEPDRLEVVTPDEAMTLRDLYRAEEATPVSLERLALLNQLEPSDEVQADHPYKWIETGTGR